MTYLELCQELVGDTDISGTIATVKDQKGEMADVVRWIGRAYLDVQRERPDWKWMRRDFAFPTVIGKQAYTVAETTVTDFSHWHDNTLRVFLTATGLADESHVWPLSWADFRDMYLFGSQQLQQGRPLWLTIRPEDLALLLADIPNAIYTVRGEYQRKPVAMPLENDATPQGLPEEYHLMIVHRARMRYAVAENAAEVFTDAQSDYRDMLSKLVDAQTEAITLGEPWA